MKPLTPEFLEELSKTKNGFYSWDYVARLASRVVELEQEEERVCEWEGVKYSPPGLKEYWTYYPPHNVSYWISAIGKEDYIFCPSCGKRIKYVEVE